MEALLSTAKHVKGSSPTDVAPIPLSLDVVLVCLFALLRGDLFASAPQKPRI